MATRAGDGDGSASGGEELLKLGRECVQEEIAVQRCRNKSLMSQTKDLIAKSAKLASCEASSNSVLETSRQGFLSASASAPGSSQSQTRQ